MRRRRRPDIATVMPGPVVSIIHRTTTMHFYQWRVLIGMKEVSYKRLPLGSETMSTFSTTSKHSLEPVTFVSQNVKKKQSSFFLYKRLFGGWLSPWMAILTLYAANLLRTNQTIGNQEILRRLTLFLRPTILLYHDQFQQLISSTTWNMSQKFKFSFFFISKIILCFLPILFMTSRFLALCIHEILKIRL